MSRQDVSALVVVDIQNGFISKVDELPVPGSHEVIPIINRLLERFVVRVASQDWHPPDHGSFASNNPGRKPFETGELGGVPQIFWPDHCVQNTHGAEFHPDFNQHLIQAIFRKGIDPLVDSYSTFADNTGKNPTGLKGYLKDLGVRELYLVGLALDYCIKFSALDARLLLPDVSVSIILDATRPIDTATGEEAKRELLAAGVRLVTSDELLLG